MNPMPDGSTATVPATNIARGFATGANIVGGVADVAGGILGARSLNAWANRTAAVGMVNYQLYKQDAEDAMKIANLNAANAWSDAAELRVRNESQKKIFIENEQAIKEAATFSIEGERMEAARVVGRQRSAYAGAGANLDVGTPVLQEHFSAELETRQEYAIRAEEHQSLMKNFYEGKTSSDEFMAEIKRRTDEANVYIMQGGALSRRYMVQAEIAKAEADAAAAAARRKGRRGVVGSIITGGAMVVGGIVGGPAGAAAGATVGGSISGAME